MSPEVTALRDLVARRHPKEETALRFAREAGLAVERIAFGDTSMSRWAAIFDEATNTRRFERLCNRLLQESQGDDEVTSAVMAAAASAFLSAPSHEAAGRWQGFRAWRLAGAGLLGIVAGAALGWQISARRQPSVAACPSVAPSPSLPPLSDDVRQARRNLESCLELERDCVCPVCRVPAQNMVKECGKVLDTYDKAAR